MKRLVICADGTWNIRDQLDKESGNRHPTNVTKVARGVLAGSAGGAHQVVYYHDGVGTSSGLDKYTGGAFGDGIEDNVRDLYRFILYNYQPGDELFLFGFSRGAFTVRTLCGFMRKVGLVEKDDDYYIPEIYDCYAQNKALGSPEWTKAFHNVTGTRPPPPVKFIGVWDTVGALGAPGFLGQVFNKGKYEYHDIELNPDIENAYQALAIDEQRKPFAPSVWKRPAGWTGTLEQAWFAGVHSNVGGGYNLDGLANEALHWIVEKAERHGLEFDNRYLAHYLPCFNSVLRDSMSTMYKAMGKHSRPIGGHIADGETVHQSAVDRVNHAESRYSPANLGAYRAGNPNAATSNTSRIPRGTPCAPIVAR